MTVATEAGQILRAACRAPQVFTSQCRFRMLWLRFFGCFLVPPYAGFMWLETCLMSLIQNAATNPSRPSFYSDGLGNSNIDVLYANHLKLLASIMIIYALGAGCSTWSSRVTWCLTCCFPVSIELQVGGLQQNCRLSDKPNWARLQCVNMCKV